MSKAFWNVGWLDHWALEIELRPCLLLVLGPLVIVYGTLEQRRASFDAREPKIRELKRRALRLTHRMREMEARKYRRAE